MRYDDLFNKATEMLENDDDLFVECVNELDSWCGFADGFRGYPMWEIDDLFGNIRISEFLDKLSGDFDHTDDYFVDTIYGISSTNDLASYYRENLYESDVVERLISDWSNISISDNDLCEIIDSIVNGEYEDD